ncbi:FIG domain-containing protein [Roseivivax sediminis]|uniref:Fructose-1-6-bisphosphatase n=1 Tax=Roseivivax sediminis TaxID=936889 RepID=A0A1I1XYS5_9RHOB|nr:hypothetical protein [Roseivivax sediminis]SFE12322.1 Fructose-1-6-bisphosphatase [Roseivivax sediminis]
MNASTLDAFLASYEHAGDSPRAAVAETVCMLAAAALRIRNEVGFGTTSSAFATTGFGKNADGGVQRSLDIYADETFLDAARCAPVALYASEELAAPVRLDAGAPLALAIDPLDGSRREVSGFDDRCQRPQLLQRDRLVVKPGSSFVSCCKGIFKVPFSSRQSTVCGSWLLGARS